MGNNSKCVVCGKDVVWDDVLEEFEHIFEQADRFGVEYLQEKDQLLLRGRICSRDCYKLQY